MNLLNIIEEIEKVDPEFQDRINPRRAAIKNLTSFGSKVAAASIPLALGSLFKKAYGQQTNTMIGDVLNFALTLEYLESEFYKFGVANSSFMSTAGTVDGAALTRIRDDENNHVNFLRSALTAAGITPVTYTAASFDLTGKNAFPDVKTNFNTYITLALVFEDTGVRAYKGQAGNLLGNQTYLTAALNIHSVEARHAARLRQMVKARIPAAAGLKPWISGSATVFNDTGDARANNNYGGATKENNVVQGGVTITSLPGVTGTTSITAAIEAFDEPLTKPEVLAIVTPFFA